jgi:5-hydroxyisourate hydrolase-like protein (transthyretin family)
MSVVINSDSRCKKCNKEYAEMAGYYTMSFRIGDIKMTDKLQGIPFQNTFFHVDCAKLLVSNKYLS